MQGKKQKRFRSVIFITVAFIVSLTLTAEGKDLIVPSDNYSHIQAAINAASYGDTVHVLAGTYSSKTNGEEFPIKMKNGVSLVGAGADVCILDADLKNKVIECNEINDTLTRIEGFTITKGSGEFGAGIFFSWDSSPIITNNIITGNSADKGGGIYCVFFSYPTIINNVITGNSATISGGGIYCDSSSPTITNNVITGNEALGGLWWDGGGGIYCWSSSSSIINNVITGNSASSSGGGIYFDDSSPTITNNTITGNSASSEGGGIYSLLSSPTITHNIITGNTSNSGGGGIHSDDFLPASFITYDDVWGNLRGDIHEDYWNCVAGTGSISVDPLFVDPTAGDYHLSANSPCIDKGDPLASGLPGSDLDGNTRIVDGDDDGVVVVDMGAFEYQGVLEIGATIDIDPDTLNLKSKGNWITAYIELPAGHKVADIDVSTLLLILKDPEDPEDSEYPVEAETKPASIGDDDGDKILDLMVKFDRAAVERQLLDKVNENVEITVSGSLIDGTQFEGSDFIRVISKGRK